MVIGFKKQFVPKILDGTKIHTIRQDDKNRWKPMRVMHMYTGGRFSKEYRQFAEKQVKSTQRIEIRATENDVLIYVDGKELPFNVFNALCIQDGFESYLDFCDWWMPVILRSENGRFIGKIIHWTDERY